MHCFCTYYGAEHFASNFDFALWRKDLPKFNLFAPHPQKRLDIIAFARILAQGAHRFRTSLSHWRPRAKKFAKVKHYFRFFQSVFHVKQSQMRMVLIWGEPQGGR